MFLEFVEGPDAGRRIELNGPVEIGREVPEGAGSSVIDPQVSRRHARFTSVQGGALVEDLESSNGTFVNGTRVFAPAPLRHGDQIQIGLSVLELRADEARARSTVRAVPPALAVPPHEPDYTVDVRSSLDRSSSDLDGLLDIRTKAMARLAPLAVGLVVVFAAILYLATRN